MTTAGAYRIPKFRIGRRRLSTWLLACAVLLVALPDVSSAEAQQSLAAIAQADDASIRPGDVIRLRVWREPELSGEFPVDQSGFVVLPKLGRMHVARDPDEVSAEIFDGLASSLNHTSIEITFLRRIQVLGGVRNPGLFTVDPTLTISDVVALAGGVSPEGRADRVDIMRFGERIARLSIRERIADAPVRSGDQIYVEERGWFSRNPGILLGAAGTAASLLITFLR